MERELVRSAAPPPPLKVEGDNGPARNGNAVECGKPVPFEDNKPCRIIAGHPEGCCRHSIHKGPDWPVTRGWTDDPRGEQEDVFQEIVL